MRRSVFRKFSFYGYFLKKCAVVILCGGLKVVLTLYFYFRRSGNTTKRTVLEKNLRTILQNSTDAFLNNNLLALD